MATLAQACDAWQGGRDTGSSPIRAAARVLTATPHYFKADFIDKFESDARANPEVLDYARTLLTALASSARLDASGWAAKLRIPSDPSAWVGRGIKSAPQDDQIIATLKTKQLSMPLWGASLDKEVAECYGTRFIFELHGPFPAIPAWTHSGIKHEELELILGGRYKIINDDKGSECQANIAQIPRLHPAMTTAPADGRGGHAVAAARPAHLVAVVNTRPARLVSITVVACACGAAAKPSASDAPSVALTTTRAMVRAFIWFSLGCWLPIRSDRCRDGIRLK